MQADRLRRQPVEQRLLADRDRRVMWAVQSLGVGEDVAEIVGEVRNDGGVADDADRPAAADQETRAADPDRTPVRAANLVTAGVCESLVDQPLPVVEVVDE